MIVGGFGVGERGGKRRYIACYVNVNTLYWFYARRQHKQQSRVASKQPRGRFLLLVLTSVPSCARPASPAHLCLSTANNYPIYSRYPRDIAQTRLKCVWRLLFDRPNFTPSVRIHSHSGQTHFNTYYYTTETFLGINFVTPYTHFV